jgi:hypothetical protein
MISESGIPVIMCLNETHPKRVSSVKWVRINKLQTTRPKIYTNLALSRNKSRLNSYHFIKVVQLIQTENIYKTIK